MPAASGFTLIELLVAIALMALMTVLAWRGLDGIARSREQLQQRADEVQTLQAALSQWGADLDALQSQPKVPAMDWDGRVLRLLRRSSASSADGLLVVAWSRRSIEGKGWWMRWQSPPLTTRSALEQAWQKAAIWAQTPSEEDRLHEVRIVPLEQWQIYYYRSNAWTNPLSSAGAGDTTLTPQNAGLASGSTSDQPDGVRLLLTLPGDRAVTGTITRDWVRPVLGGSP